MESVKKEQKTPMVLSMKDMKKWQKALNVAEIDYSNWQKLCKDQDLTFWALKEKNLPSEPYFEWARNHYGIPSLDGNFFDNMIINQELWNEVKDQENWSESFLPIYKWDNIVFAGCVEPPVNKKNDHVVPILTEPKYLEMFWQKITTVLDPASNKSKEVASEKAQPSKVRPPADSSVAKKAYNEEESPSAISKITQFIFHAIFTNKKGEKKETANYTEVFELSKKYFSGAIVFAFQNQKFIPIKWSKNLDGPTTPIETKEASMFRLICSSKQSYHGYVIKNEKHLKFFQSWGFEKLPSHATLIPVLNEEKKMTGAFLGIADAVVDSAHLDEINKWTEYLTSSIAKKLKKPLAA